ncbi:hypothetical protein KRP22_007271 [Phytophthora ramorum]
MNLMRLATFCLFTTSDIAVAARSFTYGTTKSSRRVSEMRACSNRELRVIPYQDVFTLFLLQFQEKRVGRCNPEADEYTSDSADEREYGQSSFKVHGQHRAIFSRQLECVHAGEVHAPNATPAQRN